MDLGLRGRWALVTGASQGIGEGIADVLAEEGVNLHLAARSADKLDAVAERLRSAHAVEVRVHPTDLTDPAAPAALAEAVGDIDLLVNNAGAIPGGPLWNFDPDAWRAGWALKVNGYVEMCRVVYPKLKARGGGVILNVIGAGGETFDPNYIAGATGNAGLMAFTKALGCRSLDDNVRVVGVNPGPVDTDRIRTLMRRKAIDVLGDESRWEEFFETMPRGRPAHVREIADMIAFLASDRSAYTSGTIVTIDGGSSNRH